MQESNSHTLVSEFINDPAKVRKRAGEVINRRDYEFIIVAHIGHTPAKPSALKLSAPGNLIFKEPFNPARGIE